MKLTFKAEDFKPVDGNVLVQPGPIKKIKTLVSQTTNSNQFDPDGTGEEAKLVYEKIPTKMRIGKVLAIADNILSAIDTNGNPIPVGFKVGDWIAYNSSRGFNQKLDLLAKSSDDEKCPIMMQRFEIISKVDITE